MDIFIGIIIGSLLTFCIFFKPVFDLVEQLKHMELKYKALNDFFSKCKNKI